MSDATTEKTSMVPTADAVKVPAVPGSPISTAQAGWASAAIGLGVGLLFAEMVVPAVCLAALGVVGLSVRRGMSRPAGTVNGQNPPGPVQAEK